MAYTEDQLIERVSAKIDEVLPAVDGVPGSGLIEAPVAFISEVIDKAAENIIHKAPITMLRQILKAGAKHFPLNPDNVTGLLDVGGVNTVNNDLESINEVEYIINRVEFGSDPMPVTISADPGAGLNRRDIVVGNDEGELEYIAGSTNANPDLLDFPAVPSGKVLVLKVIILDDGAGDFNKTYLYPPTIASVTNPNTRLIFDASKGVSLIPCPVDFLRFVNITLSGWEVPVTQLVEEDDFKHRIQKNNAFRRGSDKKPFGALVSFTDYLSEEINEAYPNKGSAIECFSTPKSTAPTISKFHYIPDTKAINMPSSLIDAVCWDAASQTLEMMGQGDKAQRALAISERYFGNKYGLVGEAK